MTRIIHPNNATIALLPTIYIVSLAMYQFIQIELSKDIIVSLITRNQTVGAHSKQ